MKFEHKSRAVTSSKFCKKMTGNNPKMDLVHVDVHNFMKFGLILSICSQYIGQKQN